VLLACECDARGRLGFAESPYPQRERLWLALSAARSVETAPLASEITRRNTQDTPSETQNSAALGWRIAQAIAQARTQAVAQVLDNGSSTG
jgi:tRNA nucleotidyltransferase (CCA-adding enzyme)